MNEIKVTIKACIRANKSEYNKYINLSKKFYEIGDFYACGVLRNIANEEKEIIDSLQCLLDRKEVCYDDTPIE